MGTEESDNHLDFQFTVENRGREEVGERKNSASNHINIYLFFIRHIGRQNQ